MGSPFRIPYGLALGYDTAFQYHTGYLTAGTAGLIAQMSATPNVTVGSLFYTNNSGATTISAFTCNTYSVNTGNQEGRVIRIFFLDANTTISNSSIVLAGTGNFTVPANGIMDFMQVKGTWYEVARTVPQLGFMKTQVLGSVTESLNATNATAIVVSGTVAVPSIKSISGGYEGQTVSIVNASTGGITPTFLDTGNLWLGATAAFTMASSAAYAFIKIGSKWYLEKGGASA